jgi:molecular chaperone GrpE (heat shock protein)
MTTNHARYWQRLWAALTGRDVSSPVLAQDKGMADLRARVGSLELDLGERDRQIAQMRSEYAALEGAKERAAAASGREELERLFRRLCGILANLSGLRAAAEAGEEVQVADLLSLVQSLEKELGRGGLQPIGKVGQQTTFNVALHQAMGGGAVAPGMPVTVQLPGFRLNERVLLKAMVRVAEGSARGGHPDHG